MTRKLIAITQTPKVMQLTWIINNICTNACSYCPEGLHNGKNHHYDWENAKRFVYELIGRHEKIHLSIAGGEPTLSPHLPELIKIFYNAGHTISITTNGVRTPRYYEDIAQYVNGMCFSFHPSFEDPAFKEKVFATIKHTHTSVRVMMDNRYWEKCVETYHAFDSKTTGVGVEAVQLQDWGVGNSLGRNYTPEQNQWILDHPQKNSGFMYWLLNPRLIQKKGVAMSARYYWDDNTNEYNVPEIDIINTGLNNFYGWQCDIGLESLFVHWDGDIQRANCKQGTPTRIIGNINYPEQIEWPTAPEICVQKDCHCSTDIIISKRKL